MAKVLKKKLKTQLKILIVNLMTKVHFLFFSWKIKFDLLVNLYGKQYLLHLVRAECIDHDQIL